MQNDRVDAARLPREILIDAAARLIEATPACPRCSEPLRISADGTDRYNTPIVHGTIREIPVLVVCRLRAEPHRGRGNGISGSRFDRVCDYGQMVGLYPASEPTPAA